MINSPTIPVIIFLHSAVPSTHTNSQMFARINNWPKYWPTTGSFCFNSNITLFTV